MCYSDLQCVFVAVCCSVLQCSSVFFSVLQCVAVCCSVLQCVAVCCSVLQLVAVYNCFIGEQVRMFGTFQNLRSRGHDASIGVAVCCSMLQCVAVCCSVLQCVA